VTTVPVPLRLTVCGLNGALSATANVAVRDPPCIGVNVTLIVQLAPGASELPHVVLRAKSAGSVPVKLMLVILRDAVPKLVSVTDCAVLVVRTGWVAKVRLLVDRVALGPEKNPVPLKAMDCGLPAVLSVMVTEAVRGPLSVGAKVTVMVHLPPDGRLESHVLIWR